MTTVVDADQGKRFGRGSIVVRSDEAMAVLLPVYYNGSHDACIALELKTTDPSDEGTEEDLDTFREDSTFGHLTYSSCGRFGSTSITDNQVRKQAQSEAKAWEAAAELLQALTDAAKGRASDLNKGLVEPSKTPAKVGLDIRPKKAPKRKSSKP